MNSLASIFPAEGQSFQFDWISIIYIVIFLFAVIRGIHKGFLYSLLSLVGLIVVFFLAYLLSKPLGVYLQNIEGWGDAIRNPINESLVAKGNENLVSTGNDIYDAAIYLKYGSLNVMQWVISKNDLTAVIPGTETTVLQYMLNVSGIPSFLHEFVGDFVLNALPESGATQPLAYYLAVSVTSLVFIAIAFAAVFVVGLLLLLILKHFAKKLNHAKVVGPINRILGGVLGCVIGVFYVALISAALVSISSNSNVYDMLEKTLHLSDDSIYTIGKMFYNNNFFEFFMGYYNNVVSSVRL